MNKEKSSADPLVSIIIPVYNGSNYMKDAINSALAQTYKNIEIIVVNDGSNDRGKTDRIAKSYGKKIRYFRKENGGVSSALNLGISKMKGEYFSWLSHDDMYFPEKVETEINYLREHRLLGKKVIPYSDYLLVNAKGKNISEVKIIHEVAEKKPEYALMRGLINGNSMLIPKSAWDEYGGLDTSLKATQDYEKWFDMNKTYAFVHVPGVLIKSRYHSKQVTNTSPKVRTEGNELWTKMVKSVPDKRKKELNGSIYGYYFQLVEFLKNTPYDETLAYCKEMMAKYPKEDLEKEEYVKYGGEFFSKHKIVKFWQFLQREGIKSVAKRIKNKLSSKK